MTNSLIVIDHAGLTASILPEAYAMRDSALAESALIGQVTTAEENEQAAHAQGVLDALIRLAEKGRKAVKKPVTDLGAEIDEKHREYIEEVRDERNRLTQLISNFLMAAEARARAAEAAKKLEAEKLELERQAELK